LELIKILDNLRHFASTPGNEDDDVDSNISIPDQISSVDPYLNMASQLFFSTFFGRQDPYAWLQCFLPIVAMITTDKNGTLTPISKKSSTKYWEAVNKIVAVELVSKTDSQVLETVKESLIGLIIIKHLISTIFKGHLDILVFLLKGQSSLDAAHPSNSTGDQQAVNNSVPPPSSAVITYHPLPSPQCNNDSNDNNENLCQQPSLSVIFCFTRVATCRLLPIYRGSKSKGKKVTSTSGANLKVASGAMELFCDSDDEDLLNST
jgi:hypothetical protein